MSKKLKDRIGNIALGCIAAYAIHGVAVIFLSGALEYGKMYEQRIPILKEIIQIEFILQNYTELVSEETEKGLRTKEKELFDKLSDLEKKLVPYKEKQDKAIRRAVNPLTYLTESS